MAFAIGGNVAFSIMGPLLKVIIRNYTSMTPFELIYCYLLVMMIFNYSYLTFHGEHPLNISPKYRNLVVFRSFIGFVGVQGKVAALKYMPLSTSSCIFFSSPIWATIFAYFLLKEKVTKIDIL